MRIPIRLSVLIGLVALTSAGIVHFFETTIDNDTEDVAALVASVLQESPEKFTKTGTITIPMTSPEIDPNHTLETLAAIPYWDQKRAFSVFKENVDSFTHLSLFWYLLDENGEIVTYEYAREDSKIISFAQDNGVKVLGLIANLPEDADWDPARVERAIGSKERRENHIAAILNLVDQKGFDGILIDYEFLRNKQKESFSAFIAELGIALRNQGKTLAVAVHSQEMGGPKRGQDLRVLAESADFLTLMTYDQHWDASVPGPVASLSWMRGVLEYLQFLNVDPQKIFLGMPLYGYDWAEKTDLAGELEYEEVVRLANSRSDIEVEYDAEASSPYFTYIDQNGKHEVWFENVQSFEEKLGLAKEFGLGGIHVWRLGGEDERIYDVLESLNEE